MQLRNVVGGLLIAASALGADKPPKAAPAKTEIPPGKPAWISGKPVKPPRLDRFVDENGNIRVPAKFVWEVPEPIQAIEVPGLVESNGVPMKLSAVQSKWDTQHLAEYFARKMEEAGLYIPPQKDQVQLLREPSLTGLDPIREISFTFIFQDNPDGTTTVIVGEAHLSDRKLQNGNYIAPVFPGSEAPLQTDVEGLRTLVYGTTGQEADVTKFYASVLGSNGYQQVSQKPQIFVKGGTQIGVAYERDPKNSGRAIVTVVERPLENVLQSDPKREAAAP